MLSLCFSLYPLHSEFKFDYEFIMYGTMQIGNVCVYTNVIFKGTVREIQ